MKLSHPLRGVGFLLLGNSINVNLGRRFFRGFGLRAFCMILIKIVHVFQIKYISFATSCRSIPQMESVAMDTVGCRHNFRQVSANCFIRRDFRCRETKRYAKRQRITDARPIISESSWSCLLCNIEKYICCRSRTLPLTS